MGIEKNRGFTIIEVMLFLGVTGLLAIGILVGAGVSIGQQRYRDSVNSLKSFIQLQYNEVANVINDRDQAWTCNTSGAITSSPIGGQPRGTSDCVMLGRFVTVDDTGKVLTAANVVGSRTVGAPVAASDILELQTNYRIATSPINQQSENVSWGAQIVRQKTTTPMPLSLLIIRSPLSGSIMSFVVDGVQTNLGGMIAVNNTREPKDLCVNADVGTFVGKRMAVRISAYATSQGSIEIPPESTSVCD